MPLKVRYGVPMPMDKISPQDVPKFRQEGVTGIRLKDFPLSQLPSGGMSGRISASEMFMVHTCAPTRQTWRDSKGKLLVDLWNVAYSFIGRFPWEITMPGFYYCHLQYKGLNKGFVEFEVI